MLLASRSSSFLHCGIVALWRDLEREEVDAPAFLGTCNGTKNADVVFDPQVVGLAAGLPPAAASHGVVCADEFGLPPATDVDLLDPPGSETPVGMDSDR
jgi:hypothetical protein